MDTVNKAFQTASDTVRSRTSSPTGEKPQSVKGHHPEQPSRPAPEQSADASLSSADEGSESDVRASEEALRGPSHPPAREEYSFEKEIDGKPAPDQKNAQKEYGNAVSSKEHNQGVGPRKAIAKMKERFRASGRTMKAGNHLHGQNK